ncbi:hypothetical protein HY636_04785 [Candidatus Woesearchaeota archaeon]|nr:hypothetical protein [Candidatus Woesearchaeota archaeon]
MIKMQTKNNLVRKVIGGVSGLALLVSLEGCGTTIQHRDAQTNVWYDCRTNEDYPTEHPCYSVVAKYKEEHRSSSSSGSSSSWSGNDHDKGGGYDRERSTSSEKGGHWEKSHCP